MKTYIEKCLSGEHLTVDEASNALGTIMTGQATDITNCRAAYCSACKR